LRHFHILTIFLFSLVMASASNAEEKTSPLWELGAVAGVGYLPDYPAAGQSHFQWAALPLLVYRGEILRAGDKGLVRGRLIHTDRLEFDVSLSGSFPTDAEDNNARQGMTDLDWLGEVGPRLQITLARAARAAKIDLELPLRAVFSTDFSDLEHQGFVFAPELAYQNEDFLNQGVQLKLGISMDFVSEGMADYFYEVPAGFATATRTAFDGKAGYMGTRLQLSAYKPLTERWRVFAGLNGEFHKGAANKSSPLFLKTTNLGAGVGVIWSFWQSERRVRDD
jgi:outer membrane scaffolding protein for murein synthesis (MipA/OmpV family)